MIPLFKVYMNPTAKDRVAEVLESGYIGQGPIVEQFEQALRLRLNAPYAPLSVNSGTSALDLAYHMVGVKPGVDVISTAQTCTATNGAIALRGANIIWADIDKYTGLIDPEDVGRKLTDKTVAIVAVDWGGAPANYSALRQYGIPIIEDAAHAFGALYKGESLAINGGDYVMWSFQAIKHLTTGDGGALLPPNGELKRGKLLRWFGLDRESSADFRCSQTITELGYKYQMNDIAAAIGLANLQDIDWVLGKHILNAEHYYKALHDMQNIIIPRRNYDSTWWLYTILLPTPESRDRFTLYMMDKGITVSPVHDRNDKHPPLHFNRNDGLPGLDYFSSRQIAIPVGWWLSTEDVMRVIDAVYAFDKIV
jgi:dTDP-4-amino-4,6-dideoxygalactose transaminase